MRVSRDEQEPFTTEDGMWCCSYQMEELCCYKSVFLYTCSLLANRRLRYRNAKPLIGPNWTSEEQNLSKTWLHVAFSDTVCRKCLNCSYKSGKRSWRNSPPQHCRPWIDPRGIYLSWGIRCYIHFSFLFLFLSHKFDHEEGFIEKQTNKLFKFNKK